MVSSTNAPSGWSHGGSGIRAIVLARARPRSIMPFDETPRSESVPTVYPFFGFSSSGSVIAEHPLQSMYEADTLVILFCLGIHRIHEQCHVTDLRQYRFSVFHRS